MQFHVGPVAYRLVISDRAVFDAEGNELEGAAIESRRLLIVSRRVEPARREDVALHELAHAYEFHFPPPRTPEDRAQIFSIAAKQFAIDLAAQGGSEAIVQMLPTRVPHLGRPMPQSPSASVPESWQLSDRIPCGCCDADIMCGSIGNGEPELHEASGQWRMDRWARCDACGTLMVWSQVATPDGTPLGQFVSNPPPRMLRGREADHWIAQNAPPAAVEDARG